MSHCTGLSLPANVINSPGEHIILANTKAINISHISRQGFDENTLNPISKILDILWDKNMASPDYITSLSGV